MADVLDPKVLSTLSKVIGSPAVTELVDLFLAELPAKLHGIDQAADGDALYRAVHDLASSASAVGSVALVGRARAVCLALRSGTELGTATVAAEIRHEAMRLRVALAEFVPPPAGQG